MGDFFALVQKSLNQKGYQASPKGLTMIFHYIVGEDIEFLCRTSDVEMSKKTLKIIDDATTISIQMHQSHMSYMKLFKLESVKS